VALIGSGTAITLTPRGVRPRSPCARRLDLHGLDLLLAELRAIYT